MDFFSPALEKHHPRIVAIAHAWAQKTINTLHGIPKEWLGLLKQPPEETHEWLPVWDNSFHRDWRMHAAVSRLEKQVRRAAREYRAALAAKGSFDFPWASLVDADFFISDLLKFRSYAHSPMWKWITGHLYEACCLEDVLDFIESMNLDTDFLCQFGIGGDELARLTCEGLYKERVAILLVRQNPGSDLVVRQADDLEDRRMRELSATLKEAEEHFKEVLSANYTELFHTFLAGYKLDCFGADEDGCIQFPAKFEVPRPSAEGPTAQEIVDSAVQMQLPVKAGVCDFGISSLLREDNSLFSFPYKPSTYEVVLDLLSHYEPSPDKSEWTGHDSLFGEIAYGRTLHPEERHAMFRVLTGTWGLRVEEREGQLAWAIRRRKYK